MNTFTFLSKQCSCCKVGFTYSPYLVDGKVACMDCATKEGKKISESSCGYVFINSQETEPMTYGEYGKSMKKRGAIIG